MGSGMQVNIFEAKNRLSQLIKAVQAGEEVMIANRGEPGCAPVAVAPVPAKFERGSAEAILRYGCAPASRWSGSAAAEEIEADIEMRVPRRADQTWHPIWNKHIARFLEFSGPRHARIVIYLEAAELRARFGLRTPDALHLACAQHHRCDALWTNDGRFGRASGGLARNVLGAGS